MLRWLRQLINSDSEAEKLLQESHKQNVEALNRSKLQSQKTGKRADKAVKRVYDVAEKIHIATGQSK